MKHNLTFIFFALLVSSKLAAQISFRGSTTGSGSGVGSLTISRTVAAGSEIMLLVGVTAQDKNITGVTWGGTAMTQFTIQTRNSMRVALYYKALGTLASSTTSNVVVNFAGGTDAFAGVADYSGVWQAAPFVNPTVSQAKSTTPSITFTSAVGHKAVAILGDIAASPTANGGGQTQYWTFTGSHSNRSTEKAGAPTVTLSHTLSANENWVMVGGTMQDHSVMLPVELVQFESRRSTLNTIHLNWATATETNNDYFLLERSVDNGNCWKEIGKIKGAGTSKSINRYIYCDSMRPGELPLHLETTPILYRLLQFDFDGQKNHHGVLAVNPFKEEESDLHIYPNPFQEGICNIHFDSQTDNNNQQLLILNETGQVVFEKLIKVVAGDNDIQLYLNLPKGLYLVELPSVNFPPFKKKLVIN